MSMTNYERFTIYRPGDFNPGGIISNFRLQTGNRQFEVSAWTWVSLAIILLAYPGQAMLGLDMNPMQMLKNMSNFMLYVLLIGTILFQWFVFAFNLVAVQSERTGLSGIGLGRMESRHWLYAGAFFLAANAVLSGIAWLMAQVGYPVNGDVAYLVPADPGGKLLWVLVSMTAGFCEEVAFRGYLMTRLRLLLKSDSWIIPTAISSVLFGLCHVYQGWTNVFILAIYGVMFSLLYIKTRSLWPCVIAHFLNNVIHGFWPGSP